MPLFKDIETIDYSQLVSWEQDALKAFIAKMENKEHLFPCIPAIQSFSLRHLRYAFVCCIGSNQATIELAAILKEFALNCKSYGKYTTLIIFFETPQSLIAKKTVEDFELLFWKQLRLLNKLDEEKWPQHIPEDPSESEWEYCFNGEQYFMYCATPKHKDRQSRYFPYVMMAITPRWVLQEFNKNTNYAEKIRREVRERIKNYDAISVHSALNNYGNKDNYEWKQYFLRDDNTELSSCPFLRRLSNQKEEK
ncbi:YqcI/YcgG family protein [Priestia flexa]|uniref:YqcI/YcgG family protein n=1 Tax=Priestia flexa TaxID=86664 RepID=UPI0032B5C4F5